MISDTLSNAVADIRQYLHENPDIHTLLGGDVYRLLVEMDRVSRTVDNSPQSGPVPGDTPSSGEPGAEGVKPMVYVTVEGGVADFEVEVPGSVLVAIYDFDCADDDDTYGSEPVTWEERRALAEEQACGA